MELRITVNLDNDGFVRDDGFLNTESLKNAVNIDDWIMSVHLLSGVGDYILLRDDNGNTVGRAEIFETPAKVGQ